MFEMYICLSAAGLVLGVVIAYWFIIGQPKSEARILHQKFFSLGDMRGRTLAEIERVVGKPKSWASIGDNRMVCTWNTSRYLITLQFSGEECLGVDNEIVV